jgi:hypothetical protein
MNRAELKSTIIQYLQGELGSKPSADMVSRTLNAVKASVCKDKAEWAADNFSTAKRQAKMIEFANEYEAIVEAERDEADALISEFYAEVEGRFGCEALDSSGLPNLSGSDRQVNWAFQLREGALNRCSTPDQVAKMRTLVLEKRDAKYWIENHK